MIIQWSDEDSVYIVSFPEWAAAGHSAHTHGANYEEAVGNGREALELLIEANELAWIKIEITNAEAVSFDEIMGFSF